MVITILKYLTLSDGPAVTLRTECFNIEMILRQTYFHSNNTFTVLFYTNRL